AQPRAASQRREGFHQLVSFARGSDCAAKTRTPRRAQLAPDRHSQRRGGCVQPARARQKIFRSGQTGIPGSHADLQTGQGSPESEMSFRAGAVVQFGKLSLLVRDDRSGFEGEKSFPNRLSASQTAPSPPTRSVAFAPRFGLIKTESSPERRS